MRVNSTQSRKGVKGQLPLAESRGSASGGVWGNAPTVPRQTYSKEEVNKGAGSEASLPVTSRVLRRAPKLLIRPTVLCRAKWARPNCMASSHSWSFPQAGDFAPAGASRGLCGRPRHPFAAHPPCFLVFIVAGNFASAEATKGHENRRMSAVALWKPSAPPLLGLIHLDDNRKR